MDTFITRWARPSAKSTFCPLALICTPPHYARTQNFGSAGGGPSLACGDSFPNNSIFSGGNNLYRAIDIVNEFIMDNV